MPTYLEYEQEAEDVDDMQLNSYILCNFHELAKEFISYQQDEFKEFCKERMEKMK